MTKYPRTKSGADAVRWPGLFAGETNARREAWVARIEDEACDEAQQETDAAMNYGQGYYAALKVIKAGVDGLPINDAPIHYLVARADVYAIIEAAKRSM